MEKDKKAIRREPIVLDKNTVALIHIFERCDELGDIWTYDVKRFFNEQFEQYEKSAKQFVFQLKDSYCVSFMEHLIKEEFKIMVEEDAGAFTKESADRLISQLKEINDKRKK